MTMKFPFSEGTLGRKLEAGTGWPGGSASGLFCCGCCGCCGPIGGGTPYTTSFGCFPCFGFYGGRDTRPGGFGFPVLLALFAVRSG